MSHGPLSLVKKTIVFSSAPDSLTAAMITPSVESISSMASPKRPRRDELQNAAVAKSGTCTWLKAM